MKDDSIVGVKGHWYFYNDDKKVVLYEDIYDGSKLIRINNRENHFWGHNTTFSMQYMLEHVLDNREDFKTERLNDTIIQGINCFQIKIQWENKETMPGFAFKLEEKEGGISTTLMYINTLTFYPVRMRTENYTLENPEQIFFIDQTYYDIKFNIDLDEKAQFNTSDEIFTGFKIEEREP